MRGAVYVGIACLCAGCGRYAYDPLADGDGAIPVIDSGGATDDGGAADDSGPRADASDSNADVRVLGSASCGTGTSTITIDAPGVPSGGVVLVQFVIRTEPALATVSDSQGNTYSAIAEPGDGEIRTSVFASTLSSPLGPGDTITVSHATGTSNLALALELVGVALPPDGVFEGGAQNRVVAVPFSAAPTGFTLCVIGLRNSVLTYPPPWTEVARAQAICGGGSTRESNASVLWLPSSVGGTTSCDGDLAGAIHWEAVVTTFADAP